jgi:anti-sigma regulatory factor (Ser/Thr protein kinase)
MDQKQASIKSTVEAIESAFGGRWGVWLSETRRWWAARRDSLNAADLGAGCVPFLRADIPDELAERIQEQEALCPLDAAGQPAAEARQPLTDAEAGRCAGEQGAGGMRYAGPSWIQGVEPDARVSGLAMASRGEPAMASRGETVSALRYSRVFPGRADQVREVRATLGRALAGCPMADDAVLTGSELAANAVLHSHSKEPGGRFTVRAEVHPGDYLWLEVEDGGGRWAERTHDDLRGRGLLIVTRLSSEWGVEGDELARVVWVRFDWPGR